MASALAASSASASTMRRIGAGRRCRRCGARVRFRSSLTARSTVGSILSRAASPACLIAPSPSIAAPARRRASRHRRQSSPAMKSGLLAHVDQHAGLDRGRGGISTVTACVPSAGSAAARIEQVAVAPAVQFEIALVVARGADGLAVAQFQRGQRRAADCARMLDADAPGLPPLAAERHDVAADVDQRVGDALCLAGSPPRDRARRP